jgi:fumarylacetoacetase
LPIAVDETHDRNLRSWVDSANDPEGDFPIQNLPLGVFRGAEPDTPRIGVRIGERLLDLHACAGLELLPRELAEALQRTSLNQLMGMGREASRLLRRRLVDLLGDGSSARGTLEKQLHRAEDVEMLLPAAIGDYTDFYASVHHATNVGSMFRPDNPLLPNYKWIPIGYHGRASSILPSGAPVRRPSGQTRDGDAPPTVGPSRRLDYELEVGAFIGRSNRLGSTVPISAAEEHLFGICLVNDWSARDIQAWEYQPLGPFLAKSFATTISPWIVTMDALQPFRVPPFSRPEGDPQPLDYLDSPEEREGGGLGLTLEVWLRSGLMAEQGAEAIRLSRASFREMYWTFGQMVAHHSSNGCNLQSGDLIASGTVSNEAKESRGSLLELAWRGTEPLGLPTGEERRFLEDGDEVILRGWCEREGFVRIGLGECRGTVMAGS